MQSMCTSTPLNVLIVSHFGPECIPSDCDVVSAKCRCICADVGNVLYGCVPKSILQIKPNPVPKWSL